MYLWKHGNISKNERRTLLWIRNVKNPEIWHLFVRNMHSYCWQAQKGPCEVIRPCLYMNEIILPADKLETHICMKSIKKESCNVHVTCQLIVDLVTW